MSTERNIGLGAERLERIMERLRACRVARVRELCAGTGASAATVRRDLTELERRGLVRKVHGGAVAVETRLHEPVFDDKAARQTAEKQRIARKALDYIRPRDSVFLDGGSTVLALADLLPEMPALTVVTNSLRVAAMLQGSGPRVIVVGGELRALSQTFVGPLTGLMLPQLHVDTAFMGTLGIAVREGLTTTDPREAYTKRHVMENARRVILLADGSKIGAVSFVGFGACKDVDVLITDRGAAPGALRALKRQRLTIDVV